MLVEESCDVDGCTDAEKEIIISQKTKQTKKLRIIHQDRSCVIIKIAGVDHSHKTNCAVNIQPRCTYHNYHSNTNTTPTTITTNTNTTPTTIITLTQIPP